MWGYCLLILASTVVGGLGDENPKSDSESLVSGGVGPGQPLSPEDSLHPTPTPTYGGTAKVIDCLSTFNEARTAAGLPSFVSADGEFRVTISEDKNKDFVSNVCKALMTETPLQQSDSSFNKTIALAIQDGDDGDCAAAVTHVNGAFSLFGTLPPAFSTSDSSVYKKLQAVSFVALYNPKENPKLDCGYFTCTKSETTATTPGQSTGPKATGTESESGTILTKLHGLLCATSPPALIAGQAPFDQEQFDKIKAAISSASAAMPASLALAMAGAGLILF